MRAHLLVVLCTLCLTACPKRPETVLVDPNRPNGPAVGEGRPTIEARQDDAADQALAQAISVSDSGAKKEAIAAFLKVRADHPGTTASQTALYRAGVLQFEAKDYPAAKKAFNELLFENPLFEKATDAKLKLGLSQLELGAYRDAYQLLSVLAERTSGPEKALAEEGAAKAAEKGGLSQEGLRIALRNAADAKDDASRAAAVAEVTQLVEGRVGFLEIARAQAELQPSHPAWPVLTFKLARIYYHLRDWTRLEETLSAFLKEAPSHPYAERARELQRRTLSRAPVQPKKVGVVLPLTGRLKPVGEAVLRGIQLALEGSDVQLVVKDSQGDLNLAGRAVEELAFSEGAIVALGPVWGDESKRAALVAEELGLPLLTLTRTEGITEIGPHVFRNMLTNSAQAEALAEYGTEVLGYKKFAVLYPNIPYGVDLANEFWDELQARGAEVRGAEQYEHDQTTYTAEVKKLVGRYYLEDRADYLEGSREISASSDDAFKRRKAREKLIAGLDPVVDFDALFIPDDWKRVGLVTPALAVEDVITNACDPRDLEKIRKTTGKKSLKTVTLFGSNQWSSQKGRSGTPELIERAGKFVNCSIYVDGFFLESQRPATKKFVQAYREEYKEGGNRDPGLLEAIGFDSAAMVRQLIEKSAPKSRGELREALSTLKDFDGATGTTSFDARREAKKPLFILSIERNGIKEVADRKPKAAKGEGS